MSVKTSTGLRNGMLITGSFKSLMDTCTLKIYDGVEPATADAALSGNNLLVEIKNGGTVLTFNSSVSDGVITKAPVEAWSAIVTADGSAAFYRLELAADTGALSTTEIRYQGTIGTANADLIFNSSTLVTGATQNVDYFSVSLPTL